MKLDRRHMIAALAILAASIAWNVWVFTQPSPGAANARSRFPPAFDAEAPTAGDTGVDPMTIPPPPEVELTKEPVWTTNPFARLVEGAISGTMAVPPPAAAADPVVGAILYSQGRRSAIVDGRIVGVGDAVTGAVVLDIARDAVIVQRATGERVRLALRPRGGARLRTP